MAAQAAAAVKSVVLGLSVRGSICLPLQLASDTHISTLRRSRLAIEFSLPSSKDLVPCPLRHLPPDMLDPPSLTNTMQMYMCLRSVRTLTEAYRQTELDTLYNCYGHGTTLYEPYPLPTRPSAGTCQDMPLWLQLSACIMTTGICRQGLGRGQIQHCLIRECAE